MVKSKHLFSHLNRKVFVCQLLQQDSYVLNKTLISVPDIRKKIATLNSNL